MLGKNSILSTNSMVSWTEINEKHPSLLDEVNALLKAGLTPDELENPSYIQYHHRIGINSYLSENYASKLYYDGEEWSSVQHAYQVSI